MNFHNSDKINHHIWDGIFFNIIWCNLRKCILVYIKMATSAKLLFCMNFHSRKLSNMLALLNFFSSHACWLFSPKIGVLITLRSDLQTNNHEKVNEITQNPKYAKRACCFIKFVLHMWLTNIYIPSCALQQCISALTHSAQVTMAYTTANHIRYNLLRPLAHSCFAWYIEIRFWISTRAILISTMPIMNLRYLR